MKLNIFLLVCTSFLMFLWALPTNGDLKIDVFVFKQHMEEIKWVLYDLHFYITTFVLTLIIHRLTLSYGLHFESQITRGYLIFSAIRIAEYFLFRGVIPMWPIVSALSLWTLTKCYYGYKGIND